MKNYWHEQIQGYLNGLARPAAVAELQAALNRDAELRALYLDYMNLDVALSAAAETMMFAENSRNCDVTFPRPFIWPLLHYWRRLAAAAAVAALVILVLFPRHQNSSPLRPEVIAAIASTQNTIARLSVEPPPLFPAWASPTDSMLAQPQIPKFNLPL